MPGFLSRFSRRSAEPDEVAEEPVSIGSSDPVLAAFFGLEGRHGRLTKATVETSAAVLGCIRVRSETFASLPASAYRLQGGLRQGAPDTHLAKLLANPNPYMEPNVFWNWRVWSEDIHGNAYAAIEHDRLGYAGALWPLDAAAMSIVIRNRKMVYRYAGDDNTAPGDFLPEDIAHWRGPFPDPKCLYQSRSLVDMTAATLGIGPEAEEFFNRLITNGTHFPLYVKTDATLNEKKRTELRDSLDTFKGLSSAGRTPVFPPGSELKQMAMSVKDVDMTAQLRWNLEQVSRIWRVPLPLVNDLTHGTYTNSEQAALWLQQYTIAPIAKSTEEVIDRKLADDPSVYCKFNMNSMLRGDAASRASYYSQMRSAGVMNPNEVRDKEDMNPYKGGDSYSMALSNGYITPDGTVHNPTAATGQKRSAPADALAPVIAEARSRIAERFTRDGDTERTRRFASMVAAPVVESMGLAGQEITTDDFVERAVRHDG